MQHTPGPWDWFVGNSNGRGLIRIERGSEAPDAGGHIASLTRGAENEANARLIAAAPELLAVLGLIANADIKSVFNEVQARALLFDMMERARAAIARAEGR